MPDTTSVIPGLEVGARATVTISDIAFGGEGVSRWQGFVVFVPFVLVGEEVDVEITEVKRTFARARLLEVRKASADRVVPACRYFGECGGCQYQHVAYPAQLALKRKQAADVMARVGRFPTEVVDAVLPCPQPYGYRNRIMVRSQWDKFKRGLNVGFIRHDNRLVVDIEECRIAETVLNEQLRQVRAQPPLKGGLKVVLRVAPEGWQVPRDSFFQNNFFLLPRLIDVLRDRLLDSGVRRLVDAYCGVGFFSIELADAVESFVGIEVDAMAIRAARHNAAWRGCDNGEFVAGRVEDELPGLLGRFPAIATALILDPPRKGCLGPSLVRVREAGPAQILYVSCHPATLARDLNVLCSGGVYELVRVVPLDMFPQTKHIECVADLRVRSAPDALAQAKTSSKRA